MIVSLLDLTIGTASIPWYYGFSYTMNGVLAAVYYPFPLNHVAKWAREIWLRIRDAKVSYKDACEHLEQENAALRKLLQNDVAKNIRLMSGRKEKRGKEVVQ